MTNFSTHRPLSVAFALALLSRLAGAQINPHISGVLETYFLTHNGVGGAYDQRSWAELRARIDNHWSAVWSGYDFQSIGGYDETYARYEIDNGSIRAGRLRTSFGFSDWSELWYNGFNHLPLVREFNIVGKTHLDRDDSGAEVTANFGQLQIQAASIDTNLTKCQVGPDRVDHTTATAQYGFGRFIAGAEILAQNDGSEKVYGATARYTYPHWLVRAEYFEGVGPNGGEGGYADVTYRIPALTRTELVARYEQVRVAGSDSPAQLQTVGIRQILNRYIQVNLNYGWGKELEYSSYAQNLALDGWSARVMFQVQFQ